MCRMIPTTMAIGFDEMFPRLPKTNRSDRNQPRMFGFPSPVCLGSQLLSYGLFLAISAVRTPRTFLPSTMPAHDNKTRDRAGDEEIAMASAWARTDRFLWQCVLPSFMEARLVWQLEPQVQNFVYGQEGASCDCGLVIDGASGPSLINNSSNRLTDAVRLCGDEAKVALLDFKTCSPVADKSYKGSWCFYEVCVRQTQRDACTAFIIQNPAAPHLVALVPQCYLARNKPPGRKYVYQSAVLPLFDEEQEHFPMSFAPFVMPVVFLPQALQSLDLFCRIPGVKWSDLPPLWVFVVDIDS